MVQSLNNAEMSSLEKNTGRDCQPRGHVTVFNPADNRSAGGAHWRLRCVWLRQRGMWFGVKVLISWPLRLESSWRSGAVFVQQEQAHQLRTASFCLGISAEHIVVTMQDRRSLIVLQVHCTQSFCKEHLLILLSATPLLHGAAGVTNTDSKSKADWSEMRGSQGN